MSFDSMGLYPKDAKKQFEMMTQELNDRRLAFHIGNWASLWVYVGRLCMWVDEWVWTGGCMGR